MSIVIKSNGGRSANKSTSRNSKSKKKVANANRKPKRQRRVRQRVATREAMAINLAPCSVRYAQSVLDPFNYVANELPCIPDSSDAPTFKGSMIAQGTFATGTTGFGYVTVAPYATSLNNVASILHTTSGYAGSTLTGTYNATGVSTSFMSRAPFSTVGFPIGRLVALGLRIRYIDTELARGGRVGVASASDASNTDDTLNGLSSDELFSRPNSISKPVDRRWHQVTYRPRAIDNEFYKCGVDRGFSASGSAANAQLAIFIEGQPAAKFEYAVVAYWEYKPSGINSVPATTKSHVDPVGYAVVRDFLSQVQDSEVGTAAWQAFISYTKKAAMSYIGVPAVAALG